jgi:hypothetical protein
VTPYRTLAKMPARRPLHGWTRSVHWLVLAVFFGCIVWESLAGGYTKLLLGDAVVWSWVAFLERRVIVRRVRRYMRRGQ